MPISKKPRKSKHQGGKSKYYHQGHADGKAGYHLRYQGIWYCTMYEQYMQGYEKGESKRELPWLANPSPTLGEVLNIRLPY